ncbi:aliphatic sulfonate ABC transporter substrate-binding protein [Glaciimonas sp. PCH181]|uniref:aliphatic sulfonate ABC transporter substrate-binding protein n=1 Tax=Glaciimonas sp. PCH181 TaxID=2133943 RepID=UPI000D38CFC7|nr:aliphatic sulfonate ABC transporter substrate-binding protein [Glaciimonas sp. PCH181]PUA16536.1 aliphatic sulfonate ABC transporter substrate-binding protein [Glaciimonas sp. PCH181]
MFISSVLNPLRRRHFLRSAALGFFGLLAIAAVLPSAVGQAQAADDKKEPEQIRIGFQKSAVNLVILKQRNTLEQRFKNSKIVWLEFPAGPQLLEALSVGSLDFGLTGDSPPVFAQAANKDLLYVGAEPPKPESSAILVQADSTIKTLADLKGKKVALQKGSSAHFLLVQAVKKAGLAWTDIQPIYLAPADARAAFERGSVDAWAIWDPYYGAAELALKPRVLTTGKTLTNNNSFYLASRSFTQTYPNTVLTLLDELTKADLYVQQNRKEVAQLISDLSGLNLATVHLFLARRPSPSPTTVLNATMTTDQQRVADSFKEIGLIPKAVKVADIVWQPARTVQARK